MFNPCRECKRRFCPSLCFVKDDYIKHLKRKCKSIRQFENEMEAIRRAISAKTVYRVATDGASDTASGRKDGSGSTRGSRATESQSSTPSRKA